MEKGYIVLSAPLMKNVTKRDVNRETFRTLKDAKVRMAKLQNEGLFVEVVR